ncbi:unnamed protein product [Clonostachys rosea]|uniref:Protein kinase domain-containing protein n=1 Tax=Bionectria ochroleuca TaxID=29856 RepID=A0ABY6UYT4_BIOOC|nr:unnamed protein product [Clonostachys rosea]
MSAKFGRWLTHLSSPQSADKRSAFSLFNKPYVIPEDIRATFKPQGNAPKINVKAQQVFSVKNSTGTLIDLVRDSKLDSQFLEDGGIVHVSYVSTPGLRRKDRKEERWKPCKILGRGAFGRVWLQECNHDNGSKSFRAVKEIFKQNAPNENKPIDYTRELEAIAKFSHTKASPRFCTFLFWTKRLIL